MTDPAAGAPEAELEFVIRRVQKLFMSITAEPVIDRLAHEQGLVADVIHPVKEDLVIVTGFFSTVNFTALSIDENHIPKQRIPCGIVLKGRGDFPQSARAEAIIGIQDDDDVPSRSRNPFVHRVDRTSGLYGKRRDLR